MDIQNEKPSDGLKRTSLELNTDEHDLVNASGHVQELRRQFSLVSLAGIGLTVGNVWPAVGGSILVAL